MSRGEIPVCAESRPKCREFILDDELSGWPVDRNVERRNRESGDRRWRDRGREAHRGKSLREALAALMTSLNDDERDGRLRGTHIPERHPQRKQAATMSRLNRREQAHPGVH